MTLAEQPFHTGEAKGPKTDLFSDRLDVVDLDALFERLLSSLGLLGDRELIQRADR